MQAATGDAIRTVVEVPGGDVEDADRVPVGADGVIRAEHADALGGYDTELTVAGEPRRATLYANQFAVVQG